jgi:hypothetical protein
MGEGERHSNPTMDESQRNTAGRRMLAEVSNVDQEKAYTGGGFNIKLNGVMVILMVCFTDIQNYVLGE